MFGKEEAQRANKRINRLVKKLGLEEYERLDDVMFYDYIGSGILHKITKGNRDHISIVEEKLDAIMNHLGLEVQTVVTPAVKVVRKRTLTNKTQPKRKYIKSGKYSKKAK